MTEFDDISPEDHLAAVVALDTKQDATNRGWRTALQILIVGIILDFIPILYGVLDDIDAGVDIELSRLVTALLRPILGGFLAVMMRYKTPPPAPQT